MHDKFIKKFPFKLIDLTHSIDSNSACWEADCGFKYKNTVNYQDCDTEVKFCIQDIKMHAGMGTHIDSPAHCFEGGRTVEKISLDELVINCICIDVSSKADENYQFLIEDILEFEKKYGIIEKDSIVIINTGWHKYWEKAEKYHNKYKFPTISSEAAKFLYNREVKAIGIDTLSPDSPSSGFPVHSLFLGNDKYIIENIANADKIPPVGSFLLIMPMKGKELTEAPIRLACLVGC